MTYGFYDLKPLDLREKLKMSYTTDSLSYTLHNYLVPGTAFAVFSGYSGNLTGIDLIHAQFVAAGLFFFFIGLVLSRIGSLVLEPLLLKWSFVKFVDYKDFVVASESDDLLRELSNMNNAFRTYCTVFIVLALLSCYDLWLTMTPVFDTGKFAYLLLFVVLHALFLISYRKQTGYITRRVTTVLEELEEEEKKEAEKTPIGFQKS